MLDYRQVDGQSSGGQEIAMLEQMPEVVVSKARHPALKEALRKALEEVELSLRNKRAGHPLGSEVEIVEAFKAFDADIRGLPSVAEARDVLLRPSLFEDTRKNFLYTLPDDSKPDWATVIESRLLRFLKFALMAGSGQFERLYSHFEEFLSSSRMGVSHIVHLRNFESEVEVIQLREDACIRKLAEAEHRDIVGSLLQIDPSAQIEDPYLWKDQFGIELRDTVQKSLDREIPHRFAIHPNQVLWALRLFKSGRVYYYLVRCYEHDWLYKAGLRKSSRGWGRERRTPFGDRYVLRSGDINGLLKLWDQLKEVDLAKEDLALNRFEAGLTRRDPKESLIEFMIAFENLLGVGGQELKFRMATHLAWFLGKDHAERRQMYRTFKDAYDLRSDIVHGRKRFRKKKFEDAARLQALVKKLEGYLRAIILRFLLDGRPSWDQVILQG